MTMSGEQHTLTVEELVGPVAAREFEGAPEYAKDGLREWIYGLRDLTDEQLLEEAERWIYESASVQRFRMNFEHVHCSATATYHEAQRRHVVAGHDGDCRGDTIYSRAHRRVMREQGYDPRPVSPCNCGEL